MAYFKEVKIYRPIFNAAKQMSNHGISLSPRKHIMLKWAEDPACTVECRLGWDNEKVTHLVIEPNYCMQEMLGSKLSEAELCIWANERLSILFDGTNVSVPSLVLSNKSKNNSH